MKVVMEDEASPQPVASNQPPEEIRLQGSNREAQETLWKKIAEKTEPTEAPITKAKMEQGEKKPEEAPLPDRALVTNDLKDFLTKNKEPEPNPIVEQAERLETALNQLAQPQEEPLPFEQQILQKLNSVEQRIAAKEAADEQRRAEEKYQREMDDFRARFTNDIEERKEDYPGVYALGRQDFIFDVFVNALQSGVETSQDEVLSKYEEGLKADYELLKGIYGKASNPSKQPKQTKQPKAEVKPEVPITDFTSKKAAQEALWERLQGRAG